MYLLVKNAEPIPTLTKDIVELRPNEEMELVPMNFPHPLPDLVRHRITFVTHHGFKLLFEGAAWLELCDDDGLRPSIGSSSVVLRDTYNNNGTDIELCGHGSDATALQFESIFHTLTIEYEQIDGKALPILGSIKSIPGSHHLFLINH